MKNVFLKCIIVFSCCIDRDIMMIFLNWLIIISLICEYTTRMEDDPEDEQQ